MEHDLRKLRRVALDLAADLLRDRLVILTGSAANSQRMAEFITEAGGHTVSVEIQTASAETRARFAAYEQALANPSEQLQQRLSEVDASGAALVYAGSFTAARNPGGRRVIGARASKHLLAERKDQQRELLELPGQVVALADGIPKLSGPIVVQGIPEDGVAMATSHTYLIPGAASDNDIRRVVGELRRDCNRAIVADFDVGTPCTFYGFITATDVFDLGPVEALVYWDRHTWRLHAPGILRPLLALADVLQSARTEVRATARQFRQRTGYLGAFGTDGTIAAGRYIVHEINPRICAGFSLLDQLIPQVAPLAAVDLLLREIPNRTSSGLADSLAALQSVLNSSLTPAYRLWDRPDEDFLPPDRLYADRNWARYLRQHLASANLIHVTDLPELMHGTYSAATA